MDEEYHLSTGDGLKWIATAIVLSALLVSCSFADPGPSERDPSIRCVQAGGRWLFQGGFFGSYRCVRE